MAQVELFSVNWCPFCNAAKALLEQKGVEYTDHDLTDTPDPQMRATLSALCGRTTVPQIWVNGQHIGGYTDLEAHERGGQLDALLAEPAS